jgi:hypothetical protein
MSIRIKTEKVCLVSRILFLGEESYAREVLREQLDMGWSGLTKEVIEICKEVGLPNACMEFVGREEVVEAMLYHNLQMLKEEYRMKKLEHLRREDLRYMQRYMTMASLDNARVEFRYRVGMLDNRANMGRKYSGKACPHCPAGQLEGVEESSQYWLEYQAYAELRRGLDPEGVLEDRVLYLRRVQALRTELEKNVK